MSARARFAPTRSGFFLLASLLLGPAVSAAGTVGNEESAGSALGGPAEEALLAELERSVARQGAAIERLGEQVGRLEELLSAPPPAPESLSPRDQSPSATLYFEGGLLAIVLVLGGWVLRLQAVDPRFSIPRSPERRVAEPRRSDLGRRVAEDLAATPPHPPSGRVEPAPARGGTDARDPEPPVIVSVGDARDPEGPAERPEPVHHAPTSDSAPTPTRAGKVRTNASALLEVDTLIAFENYEQASQLLTRLLEASPDNPEYRVRWLHILSAAGDTSASAEQEEILAKLMDAPLSETLGRAKQTGRDLLPGHPLFAESDRGDETDDGYDLDLEELVAAEAGEAIAPTESAGDLEERYGATVFELRHPAPLRSA